MQEQETKILELDNAVKPVGKKTIVLQEIGLAFARAGGTSAKIALGTAAGLMNAGVFGMVTEAVAHIALRAPVNGAFAFATGVAFSAPFVHHIFNGNLQERLYGHRTNGAFTKATKTSAYISGGIGAFMAASIALSPSSASFDDNGVKDFERRSIPAPGKMVHASGQDQAKPALTIV
jgi:hypothetical protein